MCENRRVILEIIIMLFRNVYITFIKMLNMSKVLTVVSTSSLNVARTCRNLTKYMKMHIKAQTTQSSRGGGGGVNQV